jgi:hypothetical protein
LDCFCYHWDNFGAEAMTRHDYIILGMVIAGIVTNFLGAAFTIGRVLMLLKKRAANGPVSMPHNIDIGLANFAFSLSALMADLKGVRSRAEFIRVLEMHAADHAIGTSVTIVGAIMAAAALMAAAITAW